MKLYQQYKNIIEKIKPVDTAWFTTFNFNGDLAERFLLPALVGKIPAELKTAEDFEALNLDLEKIDTKFWYDYRAINDQNPKRTVTDFLSINPCDIFKSNSNEIIFHPKVIFLKGQGGAYLICGSANLTYAGWSKNEESILIKEIQNQTNAKEVLNFFQSLLTISNVNSINLTKLKQWVNTLHKKPTDWNFLNTIHNKENLFSIMGTEDLNVWSPYFSKKTDQFLQQLLKQGYKNITIVPDISSSGKIRIDPEVLTNIHKLPVQIKKSKSAANSLDRLTHAKVWLNNSKIGVGSWNFSYRATGFELDKNQCNIEAGIIANIPKHSYAKLLEGIEPIPENQVLGTSFEEMDAEWEQALNKYTIDLKIIANWQTFEYEVSAIPEGSYWVVLPDNPDISTGMVPISKVNKASFRNNFKKVLKNKEFQVFDDNNVVVFAGFIIEKNIENRQPYAYNNLVDLFDSLIINPLGSTQNKRCGYSIENEDGEENSDTRLKHEYQGTHSFYVMFVAFQKLFETIQENETKKDKLDQIGYRLPGSIINLIELVKESTNKCLEQKDPDSLVYHYFMINELNRCIELFNQYSDNKLTILSTDDIIKLMNPAKEDLAFLAKLKAIYGYAAG